MRVFVFVDYDFVWWYWMMIFIDRLKWLVFIRLLSNDSNADFITILQQLLIIFSITDISKLLW